MCDDSCEVSGWLDDGVCDDGGAGSESLLSLGNFVLSSTPAGEFEVRAPGYRTQRGHLDLVAGENRVLRLVLTRAGE